MKGLKLMTQTQTQNNIYSRMYMANIIEENEQGFHRESLGYGGTPGNLGLMLIDVMKDWYEPNIDVLDESIIAYHKMLEDKDNLTFDMMEGEGFNADGMKITVKLTNRLDEMFGFILAELCDIFGKEGETPGSFENLSDFRQNFIDKYDISKEFGPLLDAVNEITVSKALYLIDIKYNYTQRHFRSGQSENHN